MIFEFMRDVEDLFTFGTRPVSRVVSSPSYSIRYDYGANIVTLNEAIQILASRLDEAEKKIKLLEEQNKEQKETEEKTAHQKTNIFSANFSKRKL